MGTEALDWLDKYANQGKWANVDKTKVAVAGQSCGGLEAYTVGTDKRIKTIGIMNSGQFSESATNTVAKSVTKPIFYFLGGPGDIAYKNVCFGLIPVPS
jgi:dienelactone hydrolase